MNMDFIQIILGVLSIVIIPLIIHQFNESKRITKLEAQVETNSKSIESINSDRKDAREEMKEMKDMIQQVLLKLTELETYQKIKNETK